MKNTEYKLSIENRLTGLETTLNEIITNHLAHLDAKVDRIQWLLVVTALGVAVDFATRYMK